MDVTQWMLVSWIPRITGTLSFIGSSAIIYMILSDRAYKLSKPSHRLMLPLCAFDLLQSAALATSTSAFPRFTHVPGSIGNMTTCKIQYFFAALGLACPMYNASLCLLYLLTIRYRLHQRHFATKIEPLLHTASTLIPLTIATVPVAMDQIAQGLTPVCVISHDSPMRWPLMAVPTICFCFCVYSMGSISYCVSTQSNKMRKHSYGAKQMKRRELEKKATIKQAIFYTLAFFITFIFLAITQFYHSYPLEVMKNMFYPLQGFWNFLLYIRPNIIKKRESEPDKCLCEIIWIVIFRSNQNAKRNQQDIGNRIDKRLQLAQENLNAGMNEYSEGIITNTPTGSKTGHNAQFNEQATQALNDLENTGNLSRPIAEIQSPLFVPNANHVEDVSHLFESEDSMESIEPCEIRRASLVFAIVDDDDFSAYSSDSHERIEKNGI